MNSFNNKILTITLTQFWWIAIWGISFLIIEYFAEDSKHIELFLYIGLLVIVIGILAVKPHLVEHL